MKLIRVARTQGLNVFYDHLPLRGNVQGISPPEVDYERGDSASEYQFYIVTLDVDVDHVVAHLAEKNPGKEIQVFKLEAISICPAAEMVTKRVTEDGILPF